MGTADFVNNRTNRLSISILVCLLISLPSVLLLGRFQVERIESMQTQQSDHLNMLVAKEVASEIGRLVDDYTYAVEGLAGQVEARGTLDVRVLKKMVVAQRTPFAPFASNMFISGVGGETLVVDSPENRSGLLDVGASIKDRDDYQEVVRTGKVAISHGRIKKDFRMPVVRIAAPIHDVKGNLSALSGGTLDMTSIQPHLEQIIAGVSALKVVVIDHEGHIIANSDKNAAEGIQDLSKYPLFQPMSQNGEAMRIGADEKGESVRAAMVPILDRGMNWRVVAYRPESYIKSQVASAKRKIFVLIGVGFVVALTFTILALRLQKNPLRNRFSTPAQILFMISLLILICLPVGLLGRSQIKFLKSTQLEQIDQEGLLASRVIARNIGQQVDRSVRVIEALGGQVGAHGNLEPKALQKIVTTQRTFFPGFTLMYIANSEGFSVAADPPFDKFGMPLAGTDYRDRDYYQAISTTGKSFVGPVRVGRRSHVPNIQIASPIHDEKGRFWAFSEGSVDLLDNISPQVEHLTAGIPELTAVVMDKGGRVVAHPEKEARQEIRDLSKFTLFHPANRPEGEVRTDFNERGVSVRAAAAPIVTRDLDWRVVVYRPDAYIQAQTALVQRQTWMMIGMGSLPGILFIGIAIYGMKRPVFPKMASPQYHA